jgi:hypothetical protein
MTQPRPDALSLVTCARGVKPPAPPFGLRMWSSDASATAVLLDASEADLEDIEALVAQIPHWTTRVPGTPVVVLGTAVRRASWWRRIAGSGTTRVARAPRCSALIACGYVDVGAGRDDASGADLAWGWAPDRPTPSVD